MLHQFDPSSVAEARQRAVLVEQQTRLGANQWTGNNRPRNTTPADDSNSTTATTNSTGQRSNARTTEPVAAAADARPSRPNALRCFTCGERGHIQTACPHAGRRGLMATDRECVDEPIYDDYDEQCEEVDEEQVQGDTGTLLMLRRNCFAPKTTEAWQRTSLFTSTSTVKGKVCRFVIDSGCSANVVSEEAVRKLALTAEAHSHPYRLLWMQTGAEVYVSQRALLTLSIGSFYKDNLYCDIAPMDVSHIILGRPWQYDREVIHNGKTNTNSFMFEGRKITLLPTPETDQASSSTNNQPSPKKSLMVISRSQFEQELRESRPLFALVAVTPPPVTQQPCPPAFSSILHDPFKVVYGFVPRGPLALSTLPQPGEFHGRAVELIDELSVVHARAQDNLQGTAIKYKRAADKHRREVNFQVGDQLWAVLTKDRFPIGQYNKLKDRKIGPVAVVERINANAYRLALPPHVHTADVFNVKHLFKYEPDDNILSGFVDESLVREGT
ncbi:hypothetical protein YC2023_023424 [Brassica napus]